MMKPARPPAADNQLALLGDAAALLALLLATLFALSLFSAVLMDCYGRAALLTTGAAGDVVAGASAPTDPGLLKRAVAAIDRAGIASGIARGILMIVLFGTAAFLLRAARPPWRLGLARVFSWVYLVLAALLLGLGVLYFAEASYALRSYVAVLAVTVVFVVCAIVLVVLGDAREYLRYFSVPFILIVVMNVALFAFMRGVTLDWEFAGRLGVLLLIFALLGVFAYAGKLIEAAD